MYTICKTSTSGVLLGVSKFGICIDVETRDSMRDNVNSIGPFNYKKVPVNGMHCGHALRCVAENLTAL